MRVRCTALNYSVGERHPAASGWLTIGREYVVLSIECLPHLGTNYRLLTDEGGIEFGLFPPTMFEVTDPRLSVRWQCAATADGSVSIAPPAWLEPGFWDRLLGDAPGLAMGQPDDRAAGSFMLETQALIAEDEQRNAG